MIKKTLDQINPEEALKILTILAKEDQDLEKKIEAIFLDLIGKVDIEEVADDVYFDLEFLDIDDVYEKSGSSRYGYTAPGEAAYSMIEEALEPYLEKMEQFHSLSMFREEMHYCMGVISGLYQFQNEASTEFKNEALDDIGDFADCILKEWTKSCKSSELRAEMEKFKESIF